MANMLNLLKIRTRKSGFPDALGGSVLVTKNNALILSVNPNDIPKLEKNSFRNMEVSPFSVFVLL